ncbi:MAG: DEAD/DEAH box helicase [Chloroflexia bacterium]|nr:DEAD/DEAH box helicase [Chloroflexia bacterium]
MNPQHFLDYIRQHPSYRGQIVHVERLPIRHARYGRLTYSLHPALEEVLAARGIGRLYAHQASAINLARRGQHVVVTTPTASGKTLCYNLPVLDTLLENPAARALYLFPTKALAQNQLRVLQDLCRDLPEINSLGTYDGDTSKTERGALRRSGQIILSNPDMLHLGILPNHNLWRRFLGQLCYVVVDEAHVYRGIFGSHVAGVLRRLRRLCDFYGSTPVFIAASATMANPAEHIKTLTGLPVEVVDRDGAPCGSRDFVLWNPPLLSPDSGERRSAMAEATMLFSELVRLGVRTIAFVRARVVAELMLRRAREDLQRTHPELVERIRAYRAGYLPEQRRQIEQALFRGELLGVTTTNALELGIDVGDLDATVLSGYPGSIASTWQQAGRSGRGDSGQALSLLVAADNPLDQYFMRYPQELFGRPHEQARCDPENPYVLADQLRCAAYELTLAPEDEEFFGPYTSDSAWELAEAGELAPREQRWVYCGPERYPAQTVNIRSSSPDSLQLLGPGGQVLETIERVSAPYRVHPGAIYLHQGESYRVSSLDLQTGLARLQPVNVRYYTQPMDLTDLHIVRSFEHHRLGRSEAYLGLVRVTQQVIGYRRIGHYDEKILQELPLSMPPYTFETVGLWFEIPESVCRQVERRGLDLAGGLHAVEHAAIGMLPLFAMCDRLDIGGLSTPQHPDTGRAQVFIYDAVPGGVGISEYGFAVLGELWQKTLDTVRGCPCLDGCPSCIISPKCGSGNEPLDKGTAVWILQELLKGSKR